MIQGLFLFADVPEEANTSYYRCIIPSKYMRSSGFDVDYRSYYDAPWTAMPETVILERLASREMMLKLRSAGVKRIIVTFDDLYAKLPPGSASLPFWKKHHPNFVRSLEEADLVIVPSQNLADYYVKRCKEIRVVPNYHDPELWLFTPEEKPPDTLAIGWGGSMTHAQTWQNPGLLAALAFVLKDNAQARLHVNSHPAHEPLERAGIPHLVYPWCAFADWPKRVASFDIGIAPLTGEYDKARSNLKVVEYGLAGIPWVASAGGEYEKAKGGMLYTNFQDMREAMQFLIDNPEVRTKLGEEGKRWAQEYLITMNLQVYPGLFGLTKN